MDKPNLKVLVITYYWPPSGGAGVQRWLKLTKYLAIRGAEVHVITVDPDYASYMQLDESLCKDVHDQVTVHCTRSFEPLRVYSRIVGKSKVPTAGFSNVDNFGWKQRIVSFLRSNLFIPDMRRGWNRYAYAEAVRVIRDQGIRCVITSSPPHSTQLVALKLKKRFGNSIKWIADFRDPWTDIYYYRYLQHSFLSHRINKGYERKVIERSDSIFTVGERFRESFLSKTSRIERDKIDIITNGFDPGDFATEDTGENSEFTISYIGTISDHYQPEVFFRALGSVVRKNPGIPFRFRMVGVVNDRIRAFITEMIGEAATFIPTVPHDKAVGYMRGSDLLLLITQGEEGTIPGKTFEYLAARRRIICIGTGDASEIIARCEAGMSFGRNEEEAIAAYLETCMNDFRDGRPFNPDITQIARFSREYQSGQVFGHCFPNG